jgi:type IX secretion system PorP/SprF family membrane protein
VLLILTYTSKSNAQQLPEYSQYSMNMYLINPAWAGSEGYTSINLLAREQWVGFSGTPKTHSLSIDSRILRNSYILKNASVRKKERKSSRSGRVGWGAHIFNDHNGLLDRTGLEGTYSYHLSIGQGQLSFGLTAMLFQLKLSEEKMVLSDDQPDGLLMNNRKSLIVPDADFGVLYRQEDFYGGFSVGQILSSSVQFGEKGAGKYRLNRQYNLIGGYKYYYKDNWLIEPSFYLKVPQGNTMQLDIQTRVEYKGSYWGGLGFRTGSAMVFMVGGRYDIYYLGYAFDYNFGSIMKHTYGSHEIMAIVRFGANARRYKWLNTY